MTDNQRQVDRMEQKLDQLLQHHIDNQVKHENLETRMSTVETELGTVRDDVGVLSRRFWPMVGALTVLSPIIGGLALYLLKGGI